VTSAKTVELIEMLFGTCGLDLPREPFINCGEGYTNPFAAASGHKMVMQLFVKIL